MHVDEQELLQKARKLINPAFSATERMARLAWIDRELER